MIIFFKKSPYLSEIHTGKFMDEILYLGFASKNLGEEKVGGCRGWNKIGQESTFEAHAASEGVHYTIVLL